MTQDSESFLNDLYSSPIDSSGLGPRAYRSLSAASAA